MCRQKHHAELLFQKSILKFVIHTYYSTVHCTTSTGNHFSTTLNFFVSEFTNLTTHVLVLPTLIGIRHHRSISTITDSACKVTIVAVRIPFFSAEFSQC